MFAFEREFHHVTRSRPTDVRSRHHAKAHAVSATYTRVLKHFRASSRTGCLSVAGCTRSGDSPSRSEKEVNSFFACLRNKCFESPGLVFFWPKALCYVSGGLGLC